MNKLVVCGVASLALAAAAAGCGGGGSSTPSATTGTGSAAAPAAPTAPAVQPATIGTMNSSLGTYLVDGQGKALYLFAADKSGSSTCNGACASVWPPTTTSGKPNAGPGVDAAKLGTTMRSDGKLEVTYDGHPLYYYVSDTMPGQTTGQGLNQFGALWYVVSPSGNAIVGTTGAGMAPSPQTTPPSSGGSSGGY